MGRVWKFFKRLNCRSSCRYTCSCGYGKLVLQVIVNSFAPVWFILADNLKDEQTHQVFKLPNGDSIVTGILIFVDSWNFSYSHLCLCLIVTEHSWLWKKLYGFFYDCDGIIFNFFCCLTYCKYAPWRIDAMVLPTCNFIPSNKSHVVTKIFCKYSSW